MKKPNARCKNFYITNLKPMKLKKKALDDRNIIKQHGLV